jgi:hypothetical protein
MNSFKAVIHRSWVSVVTLNLISPTPSQHRIDYNEMKQKDKKYFSRNYLS